MSSEEELKLLDDAFRAISSLCLRLKIKPGLIMQMQDNCESLLQALRTDLSDPRRQRIPSRGMTKHLTDLSSLCRRIALGADFAGNDAEKTAAFTPILNLFTHLSFPVDLGRPSRQ